MKTKAILLFLSLAFFCSLDLHSQDTMKILSYNVLLGFRSDTLIQDQYLQWVRNIDPDIVAYQEMNNFTQARLESLASQYGHPYAVLSKTEGYPVALSSKHPIINVQKIIDNMWHAYIYAKINDIHVFIVHLSPASYEKRNEELRLILTHAASLPKEEGVIIMGDFNAFDKKDSIYYDENLLKVFREREIRFNHRNLNDEGNVDYTVMDQMTASGFKDAYWLANDHFKPSRPTKVEKYLTYPIRRVDYIWVNSILENDIINADIIYDKVTEQLSDHYPMYIELKNDNTGTRLLERE